MLLDEVAVELRDQRFRPPPTRRVFIPKPGRGELRPLSTPTVHDRVVQTAVKIVLEAVFEAAMNDLAPASTAHTPIPRTAANR